MRKILLAITIIILALVYCSCGYPSEYYNDEYYSSKSSIYGSNNENIFISTTKNNISKISPDISDGFYYITKRLIDEGTLPGSNYIKLSDYINFFNYEHGDDYIQNDYKISNKLTLNLEYASCDWNNKNKMFKIGLKSPGVIPNSKKHYILVVDRSSSMVDEDKLPRVKESIKKLIDMEGDSYLSIITIETTPLELIKNVKISDNKNKIINIIEKLNPKGNSNGFDAINMAYKKSESAGNGSPVIIIMSDGDFNMGKRDDSEFQEIFTGISVPVTVIGYGIRNMKEERLRSMSSFSGGNFLYAYDEKSINKIFGKNFERNFNFVAGNVSMMVKFNQETTSHYRLLGHEIAYGTTQSKGVNITSSSNIINIYEITENGNRNNINGEITINFTEDGKNQSKVIPFNLNENGNISLNFKKAVLAAEFGMVIRNSVYKEKSNLYKIIELLNIQKSDEADFLDTVKKAEKLIK